MPRGLVSARDEKRDYTTPLPRSLRGRTGPGDAHALRRGAACEDQGNLSCV